VGISLSEISEKETARAELERSLAPFKVLAAAWSGGVMLGPGKCDDMAYAQLIKHIGTTGDLPEILESEALMAMVACGLGVDDISPGCREVVNLLSSGKCVPALSYDLAFPEVFYASGIPFSRRGFDAVLGNPPWKKSQLTESDFMASFDFRWADAEAPEERVILHKQFMKRPEWLLWERAQLSEAISEKIILRLSPDSFKAGAQFGGGDIDLFAPFIDRSLGFTTQGGIVGMMVPHAFHSSNSLAKLRRKVLYANRLVSYFCFENRRKLFEIHGSWKYTPMIVARESTNNEQFEAMFYLTDPGWLFPDGRNCEPYIYSRVAIERKDPEGLSFTEYSQPVDAIIEQAVLTNTEKSFGEVCKVEHLVLGRELHSTQDRWRLVSTQQNRQAQSSVDSQRTDDGLLVYKVGNMHSYTDRWSGGPETVALLDRLKDKPGVLRLASHYRLAYRLQARATDERTSIVCLLPFGCTATHTMNIEKVPQERANSVALPALAIMNSYSFDFLLRLDVAGMYVSQGLMDRVAWPNETEVLRRCLAHTALRLTCNHEEYESLWREQLCDVWREMRKPFTWPVLESDDERWEVRAAIDAMVADAYGLSREQYDHVLSSFSHKRYLKAPALCLAKFDELKQISLEEFTRKYDPYWDIPLVETLPKPVINLHIPESKVGKVGQGALDI
jgi:hypothetical protein